MSDDKNTDPTENTPLSLKTTTNGATVDQAPQKDDADTAEVVEEQIDVISEEEVLPVEPQEPPAIKAIKDDFATVATATNELLTATDEQKAQMAESLKTQFDAVQAKRAALDSDNEESMAIIREEQDKIKARDEVDTGLAELEASIANKRNALLGHTNQTPKKPWWKLGIF